MITSDPSNLLKLLGDPTRLRILALVDREELSVGELSQSLGMAQSRVSNHLRLLRDADLLSERHAGPSTFLRRNGAENGAQNGTQTGNGNLPTLANRLWLAVNGELESLAEHGADLVRLASVLAARRDRDGDFFDRVAGEWDKRGVAFTTGQARQRAAVHLLPKEFSIADLGCGTGYFGRALLGQCSRLISVDQSEGMLDEAKARLAPIARETKLEFRAGSLDALPFEDGELDGVIAGLVLHHLPELEAPITEMRRVLRPGGTAVVVELAPHRENWMRAELGDMHLGLAPGDVVTAFERAGLEQVVLDPIDDRYHPHNPDGESAELDLYVVRGRVPMMTNGTALNPR
ncbi:MAG: ubiquinone/menaquinone biosynthesis C-methylase UbiE [Planctomycetota bacterium]